MMRMRIPHSSLSRRDRCVCVEMYERLGRKSITEPVNDQMSISIPFCVCHNQVQKTRERRLPTCQKTDTESKFENVKNEWTRRIKETNQMLLVVSLKFYQIFGSRYTCICCCSPWNGRKYLLPDSQVHSRK